MSEEEKLICPACGASMNLHAMKVDYGVEDNSLIDPVFGGVLKAGYACPQCGNLELLAVESK